MTVRISTLLILAALTAGRATPNPEGKDGPIRAADFPRAAAMVQAFEELMNSPKVADREGVLGNIAHNWILPDAELERFFRHVARKDGDPWIRGMALKTLYGMWIRLEPKDLPATFDGYYKGHRVDRLGKDRTAPVLEELKAGNVTGGYAAYVAGLLRIKEAAPGLRNLAEDKNEFVRYSAGRALVEIGDRANGAAILKTLMGQTVPKEARINAVVDPYYIALACRAYAELGDAERREGIERLIGLMEEMEAWTDINAHGRLGTVRAMLAQFSGKFFLTHKDARAWYDRVK